MGGFYFICYNGDVHSDEAGWAVATPKRWEVVADDCLRSHKRHDKFWGVNRSSDSGNDFPIKKEITHLAG